MIKEIVKEGAILNLEGLSQLIWKLTFTEIIPQIVKLMEAKTSEQDFHAKVTEIVTDISKAVLKIITPDELDILFPEILNVVNMPFLQDKKTFEMYIKKAKQTDFKNNLFKDFTISMLLLSIETIFKMQNAAQPVESEGDTSDGEETTGNNVVNLADWKSKKSTISE